MSKGIIVIARAGVAGIAQERDRQIQVEGYTAENDANYVLADAADTEEARNFLLAHDRMTLMLWNRNSLEDKIKWIEYLMPKENPRPFWGECIRLLKVGYK